MVRSRLGSKLLAAERSCCRIGVAIIVSSACEQAKATPDTQGVIPALAGDTQAGPFSSRLGGALLPLRASCCACCLLATPVDAALAAAWLRLRASGHGVRGIWRRAHGCRNAAPSCSCQWSGPTDPFRLGHYISPPSLEKEMVTYHFCFILLLFVERTVHSAISSA